MQHTQFSGLFFLVGITMFVAHLLSCFFYMVGDRGGDCDWVGLDDHADCEPDPCVALPQPRVPGLLDPPLSNL